MIDSERDAASGTTRIILRPNASLTPTQAGVVLAAVGLVMAGIGGGFALLGLWAVLPFSGAEWLLLAYCFRLCLRAGAVREVITISESTVLVEIGRGGPERSYRFQRAWLAVDWAKAPVKGHPSRLSLRLHGNQVEVGRFLVESERAALARELQQILRNGV